MKEKELTAVEQAAVALRLWSNAWNEFDRTGKNKPESFEKVIEPFIQMEKERIKNAYDHHRCIANFENGEEYYNQTFKQEQLNSYEIHSNSSCVRTKITFKQQEQ